MLAQKSAASRFHKGAFGCSTVSACGGFGNSGTAEPPNRRTAEQ
jgi:hypothetical protein